jgi:uncharacterized protein YjiS (DUF1127 family)
MDLLQHLIAWFIAWRLHRRQRKELLDFLASDHRAAADLGITPYEAQQYFDRPFRDEETVASPSSYAGLTRVSMPKRRMEKS